MANLEEESVRLRSSFVPVGPLGEIAIMSRALFLASFSAVLAAAVCFAQTKKTSNHSKPAARQELSAVRGVLSGGLAGRPELFPATPGCARQFPAAQTAVNARRTNARFISLHLNISIRHFRKNGPLSWHRPAPAIAVAKPRWRHCGLEPGARRKQASPEG
jgi:hypothetical protein